MKALILRHATDDRKHTWAILHGLDLLDYGTIYCKLQGVMASKWAA